MDPLADRPGTGCVRATLHAIILGIDTPAVNGIDLVLLVVILLRVETVLLESVPAIDSSYRTA